MKKLIFMKKLILIAGVSTVLLSCAMEQDSESQLREQRQNALNYINEHNLREKCYETSYRLLEAIAKKDISEMNAIIENFPAQARPVLLNGFDVYNSVKDDFSKVIAYPHLYECYEWIMQGDNPFLTPLIVAVMTADEKILQALFEYGVHIDVNKGSPLKIAVKCNPNAIPFLIKKRGESIDKALYDAAVEGDIVIAQQLIKAGASLNSRDSISGQTPLHVACEKNHNKIVKLLLEKGAFIDEIDSDGQTPLHWAVQHSNLFLANLFLEHGANVNSKNSNSEQTPLQVACEVGRPDMVKLLLGKGASIDETDPKGRTPLHVAVQHSNFYIVNLLLEHGAKVNNRDSNSGLTPLQVACHKGHPAIVELLLEKGALIDQTDSDGQTPLHWAAWHDNFSIANLLLEHGAKVNSKNSNLQTPLRLACEKGNPVMVKLLLGKGALVDEIDREGRTPLHWAVQYSKISITNLLLEREANVKSRDSKSGLTPLHFACDKNHAAMVKLLLEKGALVDQTDFTGWTPLHLAVWQRKFAIANLLLEYGANVNNNLYERTPLHLACHKGSPAMVKLLLEKGAFVDGTDRNGQTPLHVAVQKNNFSLVDLLLEHGANIGAKDKDGGTVIECISKAPAGVRAMELLRCGAPYPTTRFYQAILREKDFWGELEGSSLFYKNYFKALINNNTQGALAALAQAKGNEINRATSTMKGLTALHWAVLQNNSEVLQALIAKSVATSNILLQTIASYLPIIFGHANVSPLVNLNCRDIDGRTPLMWAARLGYADIYHDLVKAGARPELRDKKGKMALNYAADYRNINIIREMIIDGTLSAKPVTNSN